jgi:hypothetical protein
LHIPPVCFIIPPPRAPVNRFLHIPDGLAAIAGNIPPNCGFAVPVRLFSGAARKNAARGRRGYAIIGKEDPSDLLAAQTGACDFI